MGPAPNAWWVDPILTALAASGAYGFIYALCSTIGIFGNIERQSARIDARSRLVSLVNVGVCLVAVVTNANDLWHVSKDLEEAAFGSSDSRDFYLLLVAGFMVYDLWLITVWEYENMFDPSMVAHHFVVICGLLTGVIFKAATFYMAVLFVNEISTPFLSLRFLMLHRGQKDSLLYRYNGLILAWTFFIFRVAIITALVCNATYAWWQLGFVTGLYWTRPSSDRLLFGGLSMLLLAHWALNCYWFHLIYRHASRVWTRSSKVKKYQ